MKIPLDLINGVRIASPCPASWAQMAGTDRVRQCSLCDQAVYDLSAMTAAEVAQFLGAGDEDVCVRLYRRTDGTVMTRDCPKGAGARLVNFGALIGAAALFVIGFVVFPFVLLRSIGSTRSVPPPQIPADKDFIMGKMCPVPPLPPPAPKAAQKDKLG
jgi:hypothetical protein